MTDIFKARRDLWTAKLRSGEYRQGRGALRRDGDAYCCLGVACEVFRQETGRGEWGPPAAWGADAPVFEVDGYTSWSALPAPVAEWYDVSMDPTVHDGADVTLLSDLNDNRDFTFAQIADAIDRNFE